MKRSITVHVKRRGRPATGTDPLVTARLPQEMVDAVEQWAKRGAISRSEAIRQLVDLGLKTQVARKGTKRRPRVPQPMAVKMPGIQTD